MPRREATSFLFGSVTKVLTATLVLQQVERVVTYLPEFKLTTPGAAEEIRVPKPPEPTNASTRTFAGPTRAVVAPWKVFVEVLGGQCGALFAPGAYLSYSNGGMLVAGRLLVVVTVTAFRDLLDRAVYATVGMVESCTSAAQAILRSSAMGHFPDPATGRARHTDMFMLPEMWARWCNSNRHDRRSPGVRPHAPSWRRLAWRSPRARA